jgi:hypothetical protein
MVGLYIGRYHRVLGESRVKNACKSYTLLQWNYGPIRVFFLDSMLVGCILVFLHP